MHCACHISTQQACLRSVPRFPTSRLHFGSSWCWVMLQALKQWISHSAHGFWWSMIVLLVLSSASGQSHRYEMCIHHSFRWLVYVPTHPATDTIYYWDKPVCPDLQVMSYMVNLNQYANPWVVWLQEFNNRRCYITPPCWDLSRWQNWHLD